MDISSVLTASNIGSFIGGVGVGSIGTLIGVRISTRKTITAKGSVVDQSGASARGDIVGRDKRGS